MRVVAACGRDPERTADAARLLAASLGHDVAPFVDLDAMLTAADLQVLVVAAPPEAHLPALRTALAAGVDVLCEKPFVCARESDAVPGLCDGFLAKGCVLVENCQWPFALEAFERLFPGACGRATQFELRLSPAFAGRAMLEDSLSHFLSLAQALARFDDETRVAVALVPRPLEATESATLDVSFHGMGGLLRGRLSLARVIEQPRPAWITVDGQRADREIRLPQYDLALRTADGRFESIDDPMRRLVYGFGELVRERSLDRIRAESDRIRHRARLYRSILERCD